MTSAEIGPLAPSKATKDSHATFGSVRAAERFAVKSDFKSASSSARKSFGPGLVSTSGAGGCGISSGMLSLCFGHAQLPAQQPRQQRVAPGGEDG
jgi:hypothetical protein